MWWNLLDGNQEDIYKNLGNNLWKISEEIPRSLERICEEIPEGIPVEFP